jgi:hypothetical protein
MERGYSEFSRMMVTILNTKQNKSTFSLSFPFLGF